MQEQTHIRAVIFDLGGVILRTEDPHPREALAARYGKTRAELEAVVFGSPVAQAAERGQATPEEVWTEAGRSLGAAQEEIAVLRREFFGGDRVDFELVEFIQTLRPTYTTALLSNSWMVDLPRFLRESLEMPDTFDFVISSAQSKMSKPAPEIFQLALEMVQAKPDETVFVDDFLRNIEAAAALGIHTIHFRNPQQAIEELLRLAPHRS